MAPAQFTSLVLLLPLVSAAVIALFLRRRGALAAGLSVAAAAGVAVVSSILIFGESRDFPGAVEWLRLGGFTVVFGCKFDDLAALMLLVVSFVGFFIHVFSLGYMRDDAARARFFGGLSFFMFSMIGIVLADNLFMLFVFWEFVGFSSYLLIGHWYERPSASDAAKKAFIVNRVGDFGFLLGIIACYWLNGTVNLTELAGRSAAGGLVFSRAIPLLLFCGAVGKSAQMPLHVWLPDAMEGPTPVSALIHAATMVAAGVYMLCRIHFLMVPDALTVILWTGTITALYAAICAVVQSDIKKVLAYSTLSQLGYMMAAFGLGSLGSGPQAGATLATAGVAAAMFHLTTHAFFKALLFLGSGSIIHACHHEQDIFKLGGLARKMPWTFLTFTVGVFAIIGLPFFAGFFSKDAILYLARENNQAVFWVLVFTAVLTALYMTRLWRITFFGEPRSEAAAQAHENGPVMVVPLVLLAVGAALGGYGFFYDQLLGGAFQGVLALVPEPQGAAHWMMIAVGTGAMFVGASFALAYYRPAAVDRLQAGVPVVFGGLMFAKESFDRLYGYYVAKIQQRVAMLLNLLEQIFLAGWLIRGGAGAVGLLGLGARALHPGKLHVYVYWFLLGVVLLWGFATGRF
ncbi:MAG: NADH-quinone oxidoreductase subunit L [Opitutaceae bacterium]|nr:NADH-quinone oxidoreductase subunit L [Opitutaceae bacterium]